jgi:hypothetical protein
MPERSRRNWYGRRTMGKADWTVEIVRSRKRRKTIQAERQGNVVRVYVPATLTRADEERWVAVMVDRIERREARERAGTILDLAPRSRALARRYFAEFGDRAHPVAVEWVANQNDRYGSCTPADRTIRISHRLAEMPRWVLDYVLVHELAHLIEFSHCPRFWDLVNRYPLAERARGFLLAKGLDERVDERSEQPESATA